MFLIKRIADQRLAGRIMGSFGVESGEGVVYGAFRDEDVLATSVFVTEEDCITFYGVDTGKRVDVDLVDGLARAAFSAAMRAGAKKGCLGKELPDQLKLALSKKGYATEEAFPLSSFFAKKNCRKR